MALLLITNPPTVLVSDTNWTDLVLRSNANMLGYGLSIPIFTLTNWDGTTTKPEIAEGSIIEVGGSFYQADEDTALVDDAGLIDGITHIKLVPTGGGASLSPVLTNDSIPVWDANKAGWYDSLDKFLPFEMDKASAVYTLKGEYRDQNKTILFYSDGKIKDLTINTDLKVEGTTKWKQYYSTGGASVDGSVFFSNTSSWVPTTGRFLACHGQVSNQNGRYGNITGISRLSATQITVYFIRIDFNVAGSSLTYNQVSTVQWKVDIMSNFDEMEPL